MARIQEMLIGFGKKKQADIATANIVGDLWRLNKLNAQLANPGWRTENDAAELGKGNEFASAIYKSHVESAGHTLEKYLSSEFAAWLWAYGLGKVVKGGAGPYTYTCTPLIPSTDGYELPYFSYVEQIASIGRDILLVGCAVKSFRIRLSKGPGRANATATVEFVHSGKVTDPSTFVLPAATAENLLNAYSLACTINGVDYVTAKTFESLEIGWDNDLTPGFYPGSGQQNGYQIQGRMEIGTRVPTFSVTARFVNGSSELTKVRDLTTGAATVTLTKDASNSMVISYEKMGFAVAEQGESDGHVIVTVTGVPMADAANAWDVVQCVVTTPVGDICQ